jgi:Zn-dependent M28 family amino/carboxypeptidase
MVAMAVAAALALSAGASAEERFAPSAEEERAAATITAAELRAHVRFLASDLLEGRGPATRGDLLAQAYVAAQLEAAGLEPAAPGGGWFQKVPLVGVTTGVAEPLRFSGGGEAFTPDPAGYVANAGLPRPKIRLEEAEVVFAGFGIVAPEFEWNDYAGVDVRGRVVLVMNNDPEDDPALFAGETRLYYGRWSYKYEEAARQGAAGAIIIHTTPSAAYPWSVVQTSWAGKQFELPADGSPRVSVRLWTTEEVSRRLVTLGGQDLDRLRAAAQRRGFRAVPLGVRVSIALENTITEEQSGNVIGRLAGSDARRRDEAVVYVAHHDHLGRKPGAAPGTDDVYNGAVDNATGVAAILAVARAQAALPERPARTLFFAVVTGEEQGLLGSEWLTRHPPVPVGRMAAVINVDAMNVFGRTRDVTLIGLGRSSVDEAVERVAHWQARVVKGDQFPGYGTFYRSDHFSFAKVGVPAIDLKEGTDFLGRPADWGRTTLDDWRDQHYHQPSDEWRDDYDLSGMLEDTRLIFFVGRELANAREMPRWRQGDEAEPARLRALEAARVR